MYILPIVQQLLRASAQCKTVAPIAQHNTSDSTVLDSVQSPVVAHYAILEMGVAIWNQWRRDEPLVIPNLQDVDLSGMALENINLSRANLRGARLDSAYLYDADFHQADLRGASLVRSGLVGTSFYQANLSGADLERAYLNYSDLSSANFTKASLKATKLQDALFTNATLVNASLASAEMSDSQDLTIQQLKSAQDFRLAFVSDELQQQIVSLSSKPSGETSARPSSKTSLETSIDCAANRTSDTLPNPLITVPTTVSTTTGDQIFYLDAGCDTAVANVSLPETINGFG